MTSPRPPVPRRWLFVGAVALAVVMAWLVIGSLVPGPDRGGDRVVVIGDSITALGEPVLVDRLGEEYELTVHGDFGARIAELQGVVERAAADAPDQVIVNLGTNDAVKGTPFEFAEAAMDDLLSSLDEVECVHVVTVAELLEVGGTPLPRQAAILNDAITRAASRHDNVEVVHWDRAQDAAARRRGDPAALLADGVHPDADGQAVLADAYSGVLADCGRPGHLL